MAAGMGSRFGGLKQITPVDEQGHSIIDFSMYDAWRAGFRKVVFIIKHAIEEDFKNAVGCRMERFFDVRYVFQEVEKIPEGYSVPEGRVKPWGTGHAILCAMDQIDGPFAVINSDDYYGAESIQKIYDFLKEEHAANEHAMVGYQTRNTLTENGYVSRGVCEIRDGFLSDITERTKIEKRGNDAAYTEDDGATYTDLSGDTLVSMNLWGFQREILEEYKNRFSVFLENNIEKNPLKCEFYINSVVDELIKGGLGSVRVIPTGDVWHGVTYSEDLQPVKDSMQELKDSGLYPTELWMEPAAAYHFNLEGAPFSMETYGCGHINHTYLLVTTTGRRYILQKISEAFNIPGMMENIEGITEHIAKKVSDPRESMKLVRTLDGKAYYKCDEGSFRVYDFVEDSFCLQAAETPEDFYQSALAFGRFEGLLSDYPAKTMYESLPKFHNTPDRYRIFKETIAKDPEGRAAGLEKEIAFCLEREEEAGVLQKMQDSGELPTRVTHNDTKLNNVMFDNATRRALCVVDLDTCMPGISLYDYGDAIRFGACTAAEDEQDLSKMRLDLDLFRIYTRGFIEACDMNDKEIEMMPYGAKIMTLECGVRFLTDHIDGDHYFTIHREGHNLDRARTQFKLVADMEAHWDEMVQIVREEAERAAK